MIVNTFSPLASKNHPLIPPGKQSVQIREESFNEAIATMQALYKTVGHFFPDLHTWLKQIDDPRMQGKITYPLAVLLWQAILLFVLKLGSRRQIKWLLRQNPAAVLSHVAALTKSNLGALTTVACDDTIDDAFASLIIQQLQRLVQNMLRHLIRQRTLEYARLLDQYYMIALDATGLFHRHQRHCEHCLVTKTKSGEILYSHHVLEAKLITEDGLAFSLATEHIENQHGQQFDLSKEKEKQDCELNAFKRLAPKIKEAFPQLRICLLLDSLYAARQVMDICKEYGWAYIICYKEGSIPSIYDEFQRLLPLMSQNNLTWQTAHVGQRMCWVSDMAYCNHQTHLIKCVDRGITSAEEKTFLYLTNIKPTKSTVRVIANEGGRQRWKIENQGFNMQKNGGYNLEHVYSHNENAAKCFYLCLQIAHAINQLLEHGNLIASARKKYGSLKNLAHHLLDAIRFIVIEPADIDKLFAEPFQIRLNSS